MVGMVRDGAVARGAESTEDEDEDGGVDDFAFAFSCARISFLFEPFTKNTITKTTAVTSNRAIRRFMATIWGCCARCAQTKGSTLSPFSSDGYTVTLQTMCDTDVLMLFVQTHLIAFYIVLIK